MPDCRAVIFSMNRILNTGLTTRNNKRTPIVMLSSGSNQQEDETSIPESMMSILSKLHQPPCK